MGGLVGCVGSTRGINTRKNYLQTFVFGWNFSTYRCHFPKKCTKQPHHTLDEIPLKMNMSPEKRDHFNKKIVFQPVFFRGYVGVQGCIFWGKAISSTSNIRVFHRKLFKNNIDDSGAEGIAQLFQSCPGIEDGKKQKNGS